MMDLNEYQIEAINHLDGPCFVSSCPGSGKTLVLVERVIKLIDRGINQKNILCITFTNKAAGEMSERICKKLGVAKPSFFIGTFHALCALLLRKVGTLSGYTANFDILDENDQIDFILQIGRQLAFSIEKGDAYKIAYAINNYRDQLEDISSLEDKLTNDPFISIANKYLERSKQNDLIDFSGLIYETIQLLDNNDDIREKIQSIFKYIMVDETQDTNISQYHLINLLGGKWKNIMVIGDPDQSIYKWRGSRYQNLQDFISNYDNCRIVSLSKNYRSTPEIVKVASKLIKYNTSHMDNKFETDNPSGEQVRCNSMVNQAEEAKWVAKKIRQLMNEGGWDPEDVGILYRMNAMSEAIEYALTTEGIPYEVVGGWSFYERKEVKDCIAMLKYLVNRKNGIAFHRLCSLMEGIGNITIGKIENRASKKGCSLDEACFEIMNESNSVNIKKACKQICDIFHSNFDLSKPSLCMQELIEKFQLKQILNKKYGGDAISRIENVEQIINAAGEFDEQEHAVNKYLQRVALVTSADKTVGDNRVSLMTLHAAKGLEFPIVFMIGVENNILPHIMAIKEDPINNMEEERRLAYVGMTRAKKILYITWCNKRKMFRQAGNFNYRKAYPSPFLIEAGLIKEEC